MKNSLRTQTDNLRTQAVSDAFKKRTYAINPELRNRLLKTVDYVSASYVIDIEQLVREIINSNKIFFLSIKINWVGILLPVITLIV